MPEKRTTLSIKESTKKTLDEYPPEYFFSEEDDKEKVA